MQYGRFGDPEKVQRERKILAEMSDGWGPFLASSNAQLLDVRQIEAFKALVDAQTENDAEGIKAAEQELAELKARSGIVGQAGDRSEEHTSELQSQMRISYTVFCFKKK